MIPDLGKYALWVLSAYGVSLTLLIGIVVVSVVQGRRTRDELRRIEEGRKATAAEAAADNAPEAARGGAHG